MPAWFDLRPLDQEKDEEGIKRASIEVQELIQKEVRNREGFRQRDESHPA
jgi:hypothetical protein